jgi:tetratricopeptide (TPR) repeat protein
MTRWVEKSRIGAEGADWALSLPQRLEVAGRALWFYAGKLLWPAKLTFIYPRWSPDGSPAGLSFLLAFVAAAVFFWRRRGAWGRGPLAAWLFFAAGLFPVLGFFNVYLMRFSFVADHFVYLASIGVLALAAGAVARWVPAGGRGAVLGCAVAALTGLSWSRSRAFVGPAALWADTAAKNPSAWIAHNNLGFQLLEVAKPDPAVAEFQAALALKPDYPEAEYNLGKALLAAGRLEEARAYLEQLVRRRPEMTAAHVNFGNTLFRSGRKADAEAQYREALKLRPDLPEALIGLGILLSDAGRPREALPLLETAVAQVPGSAEARFNRGLVYWRLGRTPDAEADLQEALRLAPGFAAPGRMLGTVRLNQGKIEEAAKFFIKSLNADPAQPDVLVGLGVALSRMGDLKGGATAFERALELDPGNKAARANLARARGKARPGPH